jgi:hypothetical protein
LGTPESHINEKETWNGNLTSDTISATSLQGQAAKFVVSTLLAQPITTMNNTEHRPLVYLDTSHDDFNHKTVAFLMAGVVLLAFVVLIGVTIFLFVIITGRKRKRCVAPSPDGINIDQAAHNYRGRDAEGGQAVSSGMQISTTTL